jgi:hypothetical protein
MVRRASVLTAQRLGSQLVVLCFVAHLPSPSTYYSSRHSVGQGPDLLISSSLFIFHPISSRFMSSVSYLRCSCARSRKWTISGRELGLGYDSVGSSCNWSCYWRTRGATGLNRNALISLLVRWGASFRRAVGPRELRRGCGWWHQSQLEDG